MKDTAPGAPAAESPAGAGETAASPIAASPIAALADRARDDIARLDVELAEIGLLAQQAATEAVRHEARRATAAEKLAAALRGSGSPKDVADLNGQLLNLTRRASLMEAQVEVLEGKRKALARYRDGLAEYAQAIEAAAADETRAAGADETATSRKRGGRRDEEPSPAPVPADTEVASAKGRSRLVLGAQEDMRREIARAMHDGPAQSLTNIVLQAQIVDRLLSRDADAARAEMTRLTAMVQSTLEATKTFIFDVRPMVLDDLGLVPTLRRAARDRGRAAGVPVECESLGQDRRLPVDLESALFRIVDEALVAYLERRPDRVSMRLDWGESLDATVTSHAQRAAPPEDMAPAGAEERGGTALPALAGMIEDRRAEGREAARAVVRLPDSTWREIRERAAAAGIEADVVGDGSALHLSVPIGEG